MSNSKKKRKGAKPMDKCKFTYPSKGGHKIVNPTNDNPPSDYYPTPEIQRLASAVNLNFRNGEKVTFADGVNLTNYSGALQWMPGVAANAIGHVPGVSNSPTSPLNEATRSVMNRIREQINANRDYEMPDLGKYIMAVADLNAWVQFLKKVYKTIKKYNTLNRYTPLAILRGMRIDTSDVNNLGIQLKFYIDTLTERIKNLKIPLDIPLTTTWIADFEDIYVDEDLAKAQYITNVPLYILKYTVDQTTGKSKLVPKTYFDAPFTFNNPAKVQDLIDFTEDLLVEIINDEDFAIITADIMKAYPSYYEQKPLDDSIIEFKTSDEFLSKWHNSCQYSRGEFLRNTGWEVTEDTTTYLDPYLVFDPVQKDTTDVEFIESKRACGNRIMDFYRSEVTADEVINASLWMYTREVVDASEKTTKFRTLNTSICSNIDIVTYYKGNLEHFELSGRVSWVVDGNNKMTTKDRWTLDRMILLQKFNYAPIMIYQVVENTGSADDVGFFGFMGDFGNYTIVDPNILYNIMTCILYGQFNISYLLRG